MQIKKITAISAAAAMCLSISAFAATGAAPIEGQSTTFRYEFKNDPTYTVTVPAAVTLTDEGTPMEFTASNVNYLDGKKISVSILETDYFRNQLIIQTEKAEGDHPQTKTQLRYQLILEDGTVVETTGNDTATGTELVSFTEDSTKTITARPITNDSDWYKVGTYTGIMNYNIELIDAQ